ncbi:hypothetical protein F3J19_27345 [Burkholderia sp. Ax-1724]|nr:hypothetical protein [Burkholderia sp. Ax-1724]
MSSATGASRLATLGEGVAVDDMMAELGSAANYKAIGALPGRRLRRGRFAASAAPHAGAAWEVPGAARPVAKVRPEGGGKTLKRFWKQVLTEQLTPCIIENFRARCVGKMNKE